MSENRATNIMRKCIILLLAVSGFCLAGCSSIKSTPRALVGTWESGIIPGTTNRDVYEFRRDGTYSRTVPVSSQVRTYGGTYSVEPGNLLVLTGDFKGLTAQQFFFKDDNLHIVVSTTEGAVVATYKRADNQ